MTFTFGPRRGIYYDATDLLKGGKPPVAAKQVKLLEEFDLIYRTLCMLLFNYVPVSGHPGGSISAGRFLAGLLLNSLDYDISRPQREDADIISFAAGHKTMGLYSLWAMRNEALRIAAPELLPSEERFQLRLEDLLGFRRNPIAKTPLLKKIQRQGSGRPSDAGDPFRPPLDGRLGRRAGKLDRPCPGGARLLRADAPRVHVIEGEGGLTPGRVSEALAAAGTASLRT